MSVYCQPPPYIFERPPLSKTERLQFLRWFSIAISRKVCAIADLSAVGLSKYYYLIPTAEPLQFFPHSLPASFFNELLVISNLCAVLFLFYAYSTASSRIFFFFFCYRASICVSALRSPRLGLGVSSGPFLSFAEWRRLGQKRPRTEESLRTVGGVFA